MISNTLKDISKRRRNIARTVDIWHSDPYPIQERSSTLNSIFHYTVYNCFGFKNNLNIQIFSSKRMSLKRGGTNASVRNSLDRILNHPMLTSYINWVL